MLWSQSQAARWLNVPVKTYQNWEHGIRKAHQPGPIRKRMEAAKPKKAAPSSPQLDLGTKQRKQP